MWSLISIHAASTSHSRVRTSPPSVSTRRNWGPSAISAVVLAPGSCARTAGIFVFDAVALFQLVQHGCEQCRLRRGDGPGRWRPPLTLTLSGWAPVFFSQASTTRSEASPRPVNSPAARVGSSLRRADSDASATVTRPPADLDVANRKPRSAPPPLPTAHEPYPPRPRRLGARRGMEQQVDPTTHLTQPV